MSLDESKAPQSTGYTLVKAGPHYARCAGLIDLGIQRVSYNGEEKDPAQQVEILFELPYERITIEKEGEEPQNLPRWISRRLNIKTGDKATLTKLKKALGLNVLTDIINLPVVLNVIHDSYKKDGEEKTVAKIADGGISPFMAPPNDPNFQLPALENGTRVFDFDAPSKEVWDMLPEFQRDYIKKATNFDAIRAVVTAPAPAAPAPQAPAPAAPAPAAQAEAPAPVAQPAAPAPVPQAEAPAATPQVPAAPSAEAAPVAPQAPAPAAPAAPQAPAPAAQTGRPF